MKAFVLFAAFLMNTVRSLRSSGRLFFHNIHSAKSTSVKIHNTNMHNCFSNIVALDFDGVICASSGESSYSSIIAAKRKWPLQCDSIGPAGSMIFRIIRSIVDRLRPIIETGFENMIVVRHSVESLNDKMKSERDDEIDENLLNQWAADIVQTLMLQWTPQFRDQLIENYDSTKVKFISISHFD